MNMRMERVSELVKETLGDILLKIKDPRIGFITITGVKVAPDLSVAFVFYSTIEGEDRRKEIKKGLASASGYMRRELGRQIRLKKIPRLEFRFDPSIERGVKVIKMIEEVMERESHPEKIDL